MLTHLFQIRCDANPDEGISICSSCKRTGEKCSFCRVPMKRGPSKGQRRESTGSAARAGAGPRKKLLMMPLLRKRAFSTTNAVPILPTFSQSFSPAPRHTHAPFDNQNKLPSITFLTQQQPFPTNTASSNHHTSPQMPRIFTTNQLNNPLPSPDELRSGYSSRSNSVPSYLPSEAPKKLRQSSFSSTSSSDTVTSPQLSPRSSATISAPFNSSPHDSIGFNGSNVNSITSGTAGLALDAHWQNRQIDTYYQIIHPTLPLLPNSKVSLRQFLLRSNATETQQEQQQHLAAAVLAGINGLAVRHTDPKAAAAHCRQLLSAVLDLGQACGGLVSERLTPVAQSLYLVCLVCLFLFTDESMWLSSAVSVAYSMKLHLSYSAADGALDEETRMGRRRLFLVLVVLDTMNSSTKALPQLVPNEYVRFDEATDASCFPSPVGIQLVKLCLALRASSSGNVSRTELDRVKADIEGLWDTNPVLKALYYSVLMTHATNPKSGNSGNQLPHIVTSLTSLMVSPLISVSPLMLFFFMFVVNGAEHLPPTSPYTIRAVEYLESHVALLGPSASEALRARIAAMAKHRRDLTTTPQKDHKPLQPELPLHTDSPAGRRIQFNAIRDAGLDDLATVASVEKVYT